MKHLIYFSLSRRFKNKVTIILHTLIVALLFCLIFSDKIVEKLFSDQNEMTVIYYDNSVSDYIDCFDTENGLFVFKKGFNDDAINIKKRMNGLLKLNFH